MMEVGPNLRAPADTFPQDLCDKGVLKPNILFPPNTAYRPLGALEPDTRPSASTNSNPRIAALAHCWEASFNANRAPNTAPVIVHENDNFLVRQHKMHHPLWLGDRALHLEFSLTEGRSCFARLSSSCGLKLVYLAMCPENISSSTILFAKAAVVCGRQQAQSAIM